MEREVRYCTTEDGVRIAYCVEGEGPALIHASGVWGDIALSAVAPDNDATVVAMGWRVVRYDGRGMGASERERADFSLAARLHDLKAVISAIGEERFGLSGQGNGGMAAIAYAAQHPGRISHLLLADTFASGAEFLEALSEMRAVSAMHAVVEKDWQFFTQNLAAALTKFRDPALAEKFAAVFREGMTPDAFLAYRRSVRESDATAFLPDLKVPTLVLYNGSVTFSTLELSRVLASRIPGARLVTGGEEAGLMRWDDSVVDAVGGFLNAGRADASARPRQLREAAAIPFRSVLFTDIVGHSEMMSRLGDGRGREVLREHERITREVLKANGGTEVKTMGDGFMASFGSVTRAVECAVALQKAMDERNRGGQGAASSAPTEPLSIRIGLNAGEPIEEDGDLFGATVILASRIAAKAEGGEILVADTVRGLCSGKGFLFADRGEFVAKGFEEPVRVYEVRWSE